MGRRITGQCQCGNVRYRLTDEPLMVYVCHCQDCQKQSSSAFGISMWVDVSSLVLEGVPPKIFETRGESGARKLCAFCERCGSRIYHGSETPGAPISLKAGTLSDTRQIEPIAHIWTASAQPWVSIDREKFLCYENEPDRDALLARWAELHG